MCDENDEVYDLISDIDDYGRRKVDTVDKEYAAELVKNASGFLIDRVKDDGSFVYGYAVATDTGIALQNGHILVDLFYETYAESVINGAIQVNVYVVN